jgi:photoactive yellow protein
MDSPETVEEQILHLSEAQLDVFPIGVLRLDRTGKILSYNQAQAQFAHRSAATTVGLNFFRDVAPCAAVKSFQGRFNEFFMKGSKVDRFSFNFRFATGDKQVTIGMVRRDGTEASAYIVVYATPIAAVKGL